ncbi:hypothetical protein H0H93_011324 [Arthromyces matolae]|nr:hypothetical protein H0H93_011324 [Arthromyces matolae]
MDFIKKIINKSSNKPNDQASGIDNSAQDKPSNSPGSSGGQVSDQSQASGSQNEGVGFVQERVGGGQQVDRAQTEQISDTIRDQYKNATGNDFPIADKS